MSEKKQINLNEAFITICNDSNKPLETMQLLFQIKVAYEDIIKKYREAFISESTINNEVKEKKLDSI